MYGMWTSNQEERRGEERRKSPKVRHTGCHMRLGLTVWGRACLGLVAAAVGPSAAIEVATALQVLQRLGRLPSWPSLPQHRLGPPHQRKAPGGPPSRGALKSNGRLWAVVRVVGDRALEWSTTRRGFWQASGLQRLCVKYDHSPVIPSAFMILCFIFTFSLTLFPCSLCPSPLRACLCLGEVN